MRWAASPRAACFPLSRDELVECTALLDAVRAGELDRLHIPPKPLDVLAQQNRRGSGAAANMARTNSSRCCAAPGLTGNLQQAEYDEVLRMLAEGYSSRRGQQSAYLHRDTVNHRLRARRGARLTAITCGGAIPANADYQVVLEPSGIFVGTLNEDFAIESLAGDIFQLGNTSYRILRVEAGRCGSRMPRTATDDSFLARRGARPQPTSCHSPCRVTCRGRCAAVRRRSRRPWTAAMQRHDARHDLSASAAAAAGRIPRHRPRPRWAACPRSSIW